MAGMREAYPCGHHGPRDGAAYRGRNSAPNWDDGQYGGLSLGTSASICDNHRSSRHPSPLPGRPQGCDAAPPFLLETVKELQGVRSDHGLNSPIMTSNCLMPDGGGPGCGYGNMPGGQIEPPASSPAPGNFEKYASQELRRTHEELRRTHGALGSSASCSSYMPPGYAPPGSQPNVNRCNMSSSHMVPPLGREGGPCPPWPSSHPSGSAPHEWGYPPSSAMQHDRGYPPSAGMPHDRGYPPSAGMPHDRGVPPPAGLPSQSPWGQTRDMLPQGQGPPPWGQVRDVPPPGDCYGHHARPPCRPLPSGPIPPGHPGHARGFGPPCGPPPGAPLPTTNPERFFRDAAMRPPQEDVGYPGAKGPAGHSLPPAVAQLPTPARGSAPPPATAPTDRSMAPTDRSMANGFKDSSDFIDAGADSEAEFLTSRSMPPPRRKGKASRRHRQQDEASCLPCGGCLIMC